MRHQLKTEHSFSSLRKTISFGYCTAGGDPRCVAVRGDDPLSTMIENRMFSQSSSVCPLHMLWMWGYWFPLLHRLNRYR